MTNKNLKDKNAKVGIEIDYGTPQTPATIVIKIEKENGETINRELVPEQAIQFALGLGKNPKATGIEFEKENGETEMVALPSEEVMKFAEGLMKMAVKAKELNEEKGLFLKEEYKEKKPFKFEDIQK